MEGGRRGMCTTARLPARTSHPVRELRGFLEQSWSPVAFILTAAPSTCPGSPVRPPRLCAEPGGPRGRGRARGSCSGELHAGSSRTDSPLQVRPVPPPRGSEEATSRGAPLHSATCPGLGALWSRLNQSRCGGSVFLQLVTHAGVRAGRRGGASAFPSDSSREPARARALHLGSHPLRDGTCAGGRASDAPQSRP